MAGQGPGFDADEFRSAIQFAMTMGAAPKEEEQVTFLFAPQLVYSAPTDDTNVPFDPNATVVETMPEPVRVPCAVEYFDATGQLTELGIVAPTRVELLLLDTDYEQVKDAVAVVIHGDRYNYRKTEPPSGLFTVGIFTLHYDAVDES